MVNVEVLDFKVGARYISGMNIREAVTKAGGPTEVARACNLSHPTVRAIALKYLLTH